MALARLLPFALSMPLPSSPAFAQNSTNVVRHSVKGVFLESQNNGRKAVIHHETIPGYMDAMTMLCNVKVPDEAEAYRVPIERLLRAETFEEI